MVNKICLKQSNFYVREQFERPSGVSPTLNLQLTEHFACNRYSWSGGGRSTFRP